MTFKICDCCGEEVEIGEECLTCDDEINTAKCKCKRKDENET